MCKPTAHVAWVSAGSKNEATPTHKMMTAAMTTTQSSATKPSSSDINCIHLRSSGIAPIAFAPSPQQRLMVEVD